MTEENWPVEMECVCQGKICIFGLKLLSRFVLLGLCFVMIKLTALMAVMRICVTTGMILTGPMIVTPNSAGLF